MIKQILALLVASIILSSCCYKKYCLELSGITPQFYGFTAADMDTIYITGYAPGSKFTEVTVPQVMDTARYYSQDTCYRLIPNNSNGVTVFSSPDGGLSDQHEWVIFIPSVNKTVHISDYGYQSYSCNSCPIEKGDKIHTLSTCSIDGTTQYVSKIRINK